MEKNTSKKSYVLFVIFTIIALVALYGYSIYKTGGSARKKKILAIADEYIYTNYPELEGRVTVQSYGANFSPTHKYRGGYASGMEWWDGTWTVQYEVDGDSQQFFFLCYNRMGDKMFFDGYKDHYLKGGILMRQKYYDFYEYISNLLKKEKSEAVKNKTETDFHDAVIQPVFVAYDENTGGVVHIGDELLDEYKGPVLNLNSEYDMKELAKQYARLQFQFDNKDKTADNVYSLRVETKDFLLRNNIEFYDINITIDTFYGIYNIPYKEFMEDDLKAVVGRNCMSMIEYRSKIELEN